GRSEPGGRGFARRFRNHFAASLFRVAWAVGADGPRTGDGSPTPLRKFSVASGPRIIRNERVLLQAAGGRECGLLFALRRSLDGCMTYSRSFLRWIRQVERHARQKCSGKKISERDRKQVPKKRLAQGNRRPKDHPGRDEKHVDDGVLEAKGEEGHDGKPHRRDFSY